MLFPPSFYFHVIEAEAEQIRTGAVRERRSGKADKMGDEGEGRSQALKHSNATP